MPWPLSAPLPRGDVLQRDGVQAGLCPVPQLWKGPCLPLLLTSTDVARCRLGRDLHCPQSRPQQPPECTWVTLWIPAGLGSPNTKITPSRASKTH